MWGVWKKSVWCEVWCGVCAKNICDVGRGVGSLSLNPLRMFMLNQRTFSCFTALLSVEFSSICIHISKNWHISKHLWFHLSKNIAKYPTSHHNPPTSHVVWGVPHKILQMWCRGWCGASGKNSCDVGCGVGCVEKNRVMWGVVWGVTFECFCRPLPRVNFYQNFHS